MLATGGSATKAIEVLKEFGVPEDKVIFVNLVASRKGLNTIMERFPQLKLVTACVDDDLTLSKYVCRLPPESITNVLSQSYCPWTWGFW